MLIAACLPARDAKTITVFYPMPLYQQECFQYLGLQNGEFIDSGKVAREVISLLMNPFLTDGDVNYISQALKTATV